MTLVINSISPPRISRLHSHGRDSVRSRGPMVNMTNLLAAEQQSRASYNIRQIHKVKHIIQDKSNTVAAAKHRKHKELQTPSIHPSIGLTMKLSRFSKNKQVQSDKDTGNATMKGRKTRITGKQRGKNTDLNTRGEAVKLMRAINKGGGINKDTPLKAAPMIWNGRLLSGRGRQSPHYWWWLFVHVETVPQ